MKYCSNCGKQIHESAVVCIHCGFSVTQANNNNTDVPKKDDAPSTGYAVLGFFVPIVGLILYLLYEDDYPRKAKSAGKGALAGVITSVVFSILS